jgi:adenine-specific DNA-methyltransferase
MTAAKSLYTNRKELGVVFTPEPITRFLTRWAIRSRSDIAIDPGAGSGHFLVAAADRLAELGATSDQLANQLYGVEYDEERFRELVANARGLMGRTPDHLRHADLFDVEFPESDAVIGNPPYVIRHRLNNSDAVRAKVGLRARQVLRRQQTDLYSYFIMYAASFLKQGGRLALIISDSWLDMDFGTELKTFLLRNFKIKALVGFDKRVFPGALVKTVMLLAERELNGRAQETVRFVQVQDATALGDIDRYLATNQPHQDGLRVEVLTQEALDPREHWGIYFKEPALFLELSKHPLFGRLGDLAQTRIGLQTLARKFYILSGETLESRGLGREHFEPIALSPREILGPVLSRRVRLDHFVLLCREPKSSLKGSNLLKYIQEAEAADVEVRTKNEKVVGYHRLPRLQKAGRDPWYDLKTETDRRGRYPILMPRRVFKNYAVIWNKAGFIANEDFIEINPRDKRHIVPLLALLNSSIGEFMIRSIGHVYGGGVCNLNPGDMKDLPVVNPAAMDATALEQLGAAYVDFIEQQAQDRASLDEVVFTLLGYSARKRRKFYEALESLRRLSTDLRTPAGEAVIWRGIFHLLSGPLSLQKVP